MSVVKLKELRQSVEQSQRAFAAEMGVPLRTYENLESGVSEVREIHLNAARWAVVKILAPLAVNHSELPEEIAVVLRQAALKREETTDL